MHAEYQKDGLIISTDQAKLDVDAIHVWLAQVSYWAQGIPREVVERAIRNSLCFGVYDGGRVSGFGRVITDYATFAYLCDIFVLEPYRGRGVGKWLVGCMLAHPSLQGLRRFNLITRDAHGLYERFGFTTPKNPAGYMELRPSSPYGKGGGQATENIAP